MVTTTKLRNIRASPGGTLLATLIPYNVKLTAMERAISRFKVDCKGDFGWISAGYVQETGTCI